MDCCDVNTGSGGAIFYYVCPGSALVVDDPSLCASVNSPGSNSSDGESNTGNNFSNVGMVFYYVCPGSLEVVADPGSCPEALQITEDSTVTTIVIDPSTDEETDEYFIKDLKKCKKWFKTKLNAETDIYAFPNGSYRQNQIELANQFGFSTLLLVDDNFSSINNALTKFWQYTK